MMVDEFVAYLKRNPGFKRILIKLKNKYESLGHFGGIIQLDNITQDEQEVLRSLFRKGYHKKNASFQAEKFIRSFDQTKFAGMDFTEVLTKYFGEELNWKKELKNQYLEAKSQYFIEIIASYRSTPAAGWLEATIKEKNNAYSILAVKYDEDKEKLQALINNVCMGLNKLIENSEKVRLALFASQITKDPHAFDRKKEGGTLLLHALSYYYSTKYPINAEEQSELLYRAGLIYDEVSNYTICRGIKAAIKDHNHPGWEGFVESGEPLHVSLWNMSKIDTVQCVENQVFVFENPTVFSEIVDFFQGKPCSIICSSGNLKLATLLLLDKIVQRGGLIYYGGDLDPEGLIIADKLKKRYNEKLILWHFKPEDYTDIQSMSYISETRLKKMDGIESPELLETVEIIRQSGTGAYQELLIDDYIRDMEKFLSAG
ncbi:DUF2399 domain-containing protein [Acetobacterium fimetarium]|uniref:DUF2399 domain-containing protein n=1 Tax=Acetobacterium fimetarium TaxID=52691 RepID=A0ABR6WUY0_9FIRM|nr:TIGR02679 domain-containing protein [Acetobacterium fimetarium]MBC3804429.1 DUF2399 domain-containing protein [Acetobacterium fimetarium]